MRASTITAAILIACSTHGQTAVENSSYTYQGGVYPTYSVVFQGTDVSTVEKWFKDQLKPMSAELAGKKEVMSVGTRIPDISSDTIRVFVKGVQLKGSTDVTTHVAFRVANAFVGPDSGERQHEGARKWVYQTAVGLKKNLAQKELEAGRKKLAQLESEQATLVKEKGRAEGSITKTQNNITEDQQDKVGAEGAIKTNEMSIASKQKEVAAAPSEANTKDLQSLVKEQEKLKGKVEKLTKSIEAGEAKIEELNLAIKENEAAQQTKATEIEAQRNVVKALEEKLAAVN